MGGRQSKDKDTSAQQASAAVPEEFRRASGERAGAQPSGDAPSTVETRSKEVAAAQPERAAASGHATGARTLTIAHFNDVYNIEPAARDPVGGAARLAYKVKELRAQGVNPLVLFSGDAYNPSMMSTMTKGEQMVPILNEIGVHVSCMGNHDFDYGVDNLLKLNAQCNFPWLMANVLDKATGEPYARAARTWLQDWGGVKVGIVGLVEGEWLETLGAVNVDDLQYVDFIETGRTLAKQLREQGAELLVALTHMREPNDRKLAAECPEFHLILGGHDHHYVSEFIEPHNNLLVKSGTDFRDLSVIRVELPPAGQPGALELSVERTAIVQAVPEDPATAEIVTRYMALMGEKMDEEVVESLEPLDGRFKTVRNRESNLGNLVCDVWRRMAGADIAILNSGSLRSDAVHPAGMLRHRDWVAILPMLDETVVIECTGAQVLEALENGVSQYPKLEGRFPQVSGIKFKFDPAKPPGQRIVPGSAFVVNHGSNRPAPPQPLDLARPYKVTVKEYLAQGKDGFDVLENCRVLVDGESSVLLPTALQNHFMALEVLSKWDERKVHLTPKLIAWRMRAAASSNKNLEGQAEAEPDPAHPDPDPSQPASGRHTQGLAVHHPQTGAYCIAPVVEGRIVNIAEEDGQQQEEEEEGEEQQQEAAVEGAAAADGVAEAAREGEAPVQQAGAGGAEDR